MFNDCPHCHNVYPSGKIEPIPTFKEDGRIICHCKDCNIMFPIPRLQGEEIQNVLDDSAVSMARKKDNPRKFEFPRFRRYLYSSSAFPHLAYFLKKKIRRKGNALDIGCYTGGFCHVLEWAGFEAFGLEPQAWAVDIAKNHELNVYHGLFPDSVPVEVMSKKYSLISLMEAICYLPDLHKSMLMIRKMLSDRGYLLIKCHQMNSIYYKKTTGSVFRRYGQQVQFIPTVDGLVNILVKSGFEIKSLRGGTPIWILEQTDPSGFFKKLPNPIKMLLHKTYELLSPKSSSDTLIILAQKRGGDA